MTPPAQHQDELLEALAEEAVAESLGKIPPEVRATLSAEVLQEIHWLMVEELLLTPEGRLRLRRSLDDPAVEQSDEVARGDARPSEEEAAG